MLSQWRPRERLVGRLACAPEVPLYVSAVPSADLALADGRLEALTSVLVDANGDRVLDVESAGMLPVREWNAIESEVTAAFARVCPIRSAIDGPAWNDALTAGARANPQIVTAMSTCFDVLPGAKKAILLERPDRYWGKPVAECLDSHLMCMRAVRVLLER